MTANWLLKIFILIICTIISGFLILYLGFSFFFILVIIFLLFFLFYFPREAFFLLIAYFPFQIALNPTPRIDLASIRIFIIIFFLFWLFKSLSKKYIFIPKTIQSWSLLFFLFLVILSLLMAKNYEWALRKILFLGSIFPLYFLISDSNYTGIYSKNPVKEKSKLVFVLIGSAVIMSLIGIFQFFAQFILGRECIFVFYKNFIAPIFFGKNFGKLVLNNPSWLVEISGKPLMRAISLFPDPHMLAFFIGMTLPFAFSFLFFSKKYKALLIIAVICLTCALFLTFSRGGYFSIIISITVILFLGRKKISHNTKILFTFFSIVCLIFLFLWGSPIVYRFMSSFDLAEGSNLERLEIWNESFSIWTSSPWLGVGIGNYPLKINPSIDYRSPITSHNLYLDILSETGIFALLIWLFLIFGTIFYLFKLISIFPKKTNNNKMKKEIKSEEFNLVLGLIGSLVYFSIHAFFETPIYNPQILTLFIIIIGFSSFLKVTKQNAY